MFRTLTTISLGAFLTLAACHSAEEVDSAFARGVPRQDILMMNVPGATTSALTLEQGSQALTGVTAEWYTITRNVSHIVNTGAIAVGALVKLVILHPPTHISQDQAVWGPWQGPLDPVEWKVTIVRIAPHQYVYTFEGREKNSPAAAFVTVLSGSHSPALGILGEELEGFGSGSFTLDFNARATLPHPNPDELGTIHYTYSHPGIGQKVEILAQFLGVRDKEQPGKLIDADYTYTQIPQAEGSMTFVHTVPAVTGAAGKEAKVHSRWLWNGSGRSDVSATSTDSVLTYTVSECWDTRYLSVYQSTAISPLPAQTEGDPALCAFPTAEFVTP